MRWFSPSSLSFSGLIVLAVLLSGFVYSDKILSFAETFAYPGKILYASPSPYQRIILTQAGDSLSLFLNGNLQFNSRDDSLPRGLGAFSDGGDF